MTYFVQESNEAASQIMNGTMSKEISEKSLRPVRNRRYTRRSLVVGQRPQKRLFTPEIKRYLKDWLVRRRENPYPNREEKKHLANATGLTYIQICNWFANWRRKLKNVNIMNRNQHSWGHLIKTYNNRAQGNVEQFSISSDDSIWSEPDPSRSPESEPLDIYMEMEVNAETDVIVYHQEDSGSSVTSKENLETLDDNSNVHVRNYNESLDTESNNLTSPLLLSKWLESAARFQPSETNYSCWANGKHKNKSCGAKNQRLTALNQISRHDRDEVEAAVALTNLAAASSRLTAP